MKALTKEQLEERRKAYRIVFGSVAGQAVLRDLAEFCRANRSSLTPSQQGSVDPYLTIAMEGRREVWLRIEAHSGLSAEDLLTVLGGRSIKPPIEDDDDVFDAQLDEPLP